MSAMATTSESSVRACLCFSSPASLSIRTSGSRAVDRRARRAPARVARVSNTRCSAASERGDDETIGSFDELFTSIWRRVSGGGDAKGGARGALSSPVSSFGSSGDAWRYVLSTTVIAKKGSERDMARLLSGLQGAADENGVLSRAVNEDPEEAGVFLVLEHFADQSAMTRYQRSDQYQAFVRDVQPLLEKPMGVYLCKERNGQITHGYYPFGPGGEGGRDDMVFR